MPFKILIMKIVTFLMSPSALTRVLRVVPIRVDFSLLLSGFFLIMKWISLYHQVDFSSSKFGFLFSVKLIFFIIKWMKIVTFSMSPGALARVFGLVLVRV